MGLSPWTHLKRLSKSFGASKWKLFDGVTIKQCWDSTIPLLYVLMIQPCIHKGEICVFLSLQYSICTLESSDCSCGALQLILLSKLAVKRSLPPGSNVHGCYSNVRRTCKGRICSYQPETIRLSVYIVIRHQYFSMERIIKGMPPLWIWLIMNSDWAGLYLSLHQTFLFWLGCVKDKLKRLQSSTDNLCIPTVVLQSLLKPM